MLPQSLQKEMQPSGHHDFIQRDSCPLQNRNKLYCFYDTKGAIISESKSKRIHFPLSFLYLSTWSLAILPHNTTCSAPSTSVPGLLALFGTLDTRVTFPLSSY